MNKNISAKENISFNKILGGLYSNLIPRKDFVLEKLLFYQAYSERPHFFTGGEKKAKLYFKHIHFRNTNFFAGCPVCTFQKGQAKYYTILLVRKKPTADI